MNEEELNLQRIVFENLGQNSEEVRNAQIGMEEERRRMIEEAERERQQNQSNGRGF
jgi:hypothetical protein